MVSFGEMDEKASQVFKECASIKEKDIHQHMSSSLHSRHRASLVRPLAWVILPAICFLLAFLIIFQDWMAAFQHQVDLARRQNLLQQVSLARSAIEPVVEQVRKGILRSEEGLEEVRRLVRAMTYEDSNGKNYIFMSRYDGTMLIQPFEPHMEMSNQWHLRDARGVPIIQKLVQIARSEPSGGYLTYQYHLPGVHETQEKMAFVIGIPELDCYLGTGMYLQEGAKEQAAILLRAKHGAVGLVIAVLIPMCVAVLIIMQRNRQLYAEVQWRKRAEVALRESEEKYRGLVQNVNSIILRMDCKGNVIFMNEFALKFFGFREEEILGKSVLGTIVPETESTGRDLVAMIQDIGRNPHRYVHNENENMRKNGERVWIVWTNNAVRDSHGDVTEILCVGNDITAYRRLQEERLEMERHLLHTQKLESLGILAGGIAHDFNNLLTVIHGHLELALLDPSSTPAVRTAVLQAGNAARRAADLTRQMLAYSGRGHFVVENLNLTELVEDNVSMLKSAVSKNTTFDLRLDPDLPLLRGDAGQIQQVIMNLITNASESLDAKAGTVSLSTGEGTFDAAYLKRSCLAEIPPGGHFVWLEVADTGCGMDKSVQDRLFEPFFTTKFTGRGLGMAAVLGIVRGHRGALMVESVVGEGTTIRVLFPALAAPRVKPCRTRHDFTSTRPIQNIDEHSSTVLVVDDEETVRELCGEMLRNMGFRTLLAADGHDALRIFRDHGGGIDCVLLDLMMPGLDGVGTYQELQRMDPNVKVILCSGYSVEEATERFAGFELAGFIGKPYGLRQLRHELERALVTDPGGRRMAS